MKQCVENSPVTSMESDWFQNILGLIPDHLTQNANMQVFIEELFKEVKVEWTNSMKKSMGKLYSLFCFFLTIPDDLAFTLVQTRFGQQCIILFLDGLNTC